MRFQAGGHLLIALLVHELIRQHSCDVCVCNKPRREAEAIRTCTRQNAVDVTVANLKGL